MMVADQEKKKTVPDFRPGDTVRVSIKVIEGESERVQAFEGTVISRRGAGELQSFTVRKISFGVGVERTFPLNSPHIDKIEVVKSGKVRRARLYYLRNLSGKAARVDEKEEPTTGSSAPSAPKAAAESKAETKSHAEKKAKPASDAGSSKAEPGAQAVAPARK